MSFRVRSWHMRVPKGRKLGFALFALGFRC
jgi:hypothetical protein